LADWRRLRLLAWPSADAEERCRFCRRRALFHTCLKEGRNSKGAADCSFVRVVVVFLALSSGHGSSFIFIGRASSYSNSSSLARPHRMSVVPERRVRKFDEASTFGLIADWRAFERVDERENPLHITYP